MRTHRLLYSLATLSFLLHSEALARIHVLSLDQRGDFVQLPSDLFLDFEAATVEAGVKWEDFSYACCGSCWNASASRCAKRPTDWKTSTPGAWQPQLICMDMRMPLLDGYEATRRIRAAEGEERTKILALTASAFEEDRQQVLAAGCDDFACKPYREEDLLARIGSQLGALFLCADEIVRLTATGAT